MLIDGNGVSLGEILPASSNNDWWVWDGQQMLHYNFLGLPAVRSPFTTWFASDDCSGAPLLMSTDPGLNGMILMPDSGSWDGVSYFDIESISQVGSFLNAHSALDYYTGGCRYLEFGTGDAEFYEVTPGAKVDRVRPPLTPAVQP